MEPEPSPEEIMRQQEEKLRAKYGDLKPKKKLIHKDVKYFDSADYSLQQQDKEHHRGEEDVRTLPVKMGSSPPKSNMSK
eukprot:CAMPEP_0203001556 /NCGR_PEP_ID=MMETSP1401-20130829/649_1 /ASSEMBLY_ACC=CAM_ASM_000894 /TAXON_ID=38833 /ORGANISM="Micromonas pusilla, Strain CCAC1681" /LENGTH=78 /DNA_ID=CAMNT_0049743035 /DNA_START=114 /DNA_END=350 /DNA_ORIENTATION=+